MVFQKAYTIGMLFICLCFQLIASPKSQKVLSIQQVISLAQKQSVQAVVAKNRYEKSYWAHQSYKANQLPELTFWGNLPAYNKKYTAYQHEDGSYSYVPNNHLSLDGGLSINQNLPFSGGKIAINTSLNFSNQIGGRSEFLSLPFTITLTQPILGVNHQKWERRIEPVRFEESKAIYQEEMSEVVLAAISHYFQILLAQSNVEIARQNLENAHKLYQIARARRKIGQISASDLMQLELETLQSEASLTERESQLRAQKFALNAFLRLDETQLLQFVTPDTAPFSGVNHQKVIDQAMQNNSFAKNILRRQREAEYAVATAKGNKRKIDLFASFGYTGVGERFETSYRDLVNNQIVQLGFSIPLLDWGKRKAKVKEAESDKEVTESMIQQEKISFNQELFLLVENFNRQAKQLTIAKNAREIALQRYQIAFDTFVAGEINILDLHAARDARDGAAQRLIEDMYLYWSYFYQIESVTLVDLKELLY